MGTAGEIPNVNFSLMADEQRMGLADLPGKQVEMRVVARADECYRTHERDGRFAGVMTEWDERRPWSLPGRWSFGALAGRGA